MTDSGDYICALTVIYWWPFYAVLNNYSSRSCKDFKKLMNLYYTVIICTHLLATSVNVWWKKYALFTELPYSTVA